METCNEWYEGIHRRIGTLQKRWSPAGWRRYKLSLFMRVARRVADFSTECQECRDFRNKMTDLSEKLTHSPQVTRREYRSYLTTFKKVIKHLRRKHGLVEDKQYIKRFVSIGVAFGLSLIVFGYLLTNIGITLLVFSVTLPALFVRVIFGYAVGYLLDRRAKKQSRVI
jgi:hypothetical protein